MEFSIKKSLSWVSQSNCLFGCMFVYSYISEELENSFFLKLWRRIFDIIVGIGNTYKNTLHLLHGGCLWNIFCLFCLLLLFYVPKLWNYVQCSWYYYEGLCTRKIVSPHFPFNWGQLLDIFLAYSGICFCF